MKKFLVLMTALLAGTLISAPVWAAEVSTQPVAPQMEEVNLDEATPPDVASDEFDDDDDSAITFDFVINAIPAALLIDMSGNNFGVTEDGSGARSTSSSVYMMPNIAAGVGAMVSDRVYLDALAGVGVIINESLRSFFVQGMISGTYAFSESLSIGPRLGILQFLDTEWLADSELLDEVSFEDATGTMIGLQIAMGDRVRYLVNIDYVMVDFDLDTLPAGVTADDDALELQGLAVQFGVRGEF